MKDNDIIQLYWDRNEQAIPATADKYGNYCASIARNILGNHEDAEECVNDTYWNAWNSMPPHRPNNLSAFLGKITRNLSFNKYKYTTAEKRRAEVTFILDELAECISGDNTVEQTMEHQELVNAINSFARGLSQKKRNIFVRRYWYADAVSSIAKDYGMLQGSVSKMLERIRKELAVYLRERGFAV